jgi:tellurite resistance protein TerC
LIKRTLHITYKAARRIVIGVVGATVLLLGVVMIVTPGPAFVVIPVGLAILSIEFAWARHWLKHLREVISNRNSSRLNDRAEAHRDRTMD